MNDAAGLSESTGRPLRIGIGLIVLAIILLVWRSSLDGSFQFDDHSNILDPQRIEPLWPVTPYLSSNRPVGLYSLAVNRHFSGDSPRGFHLFNLVVHSLNAILIYVGIGLSRRLWLRCRRLPPEVSLFWTLAAALVALVWAIHPLTTQAVTYIVQRYESMAAMGYLGVWVGWLWVVDGQRRSPRVAGHVMIAIAAWVGLMSKEIFASAPLAVLLLDRQLTRQRFGLILRRRWVAYGFMVSPFLWFIPSVARWFDPSRSSSMGFGMKQISSWEYLRTQPEVILHYLRLAIWPDPLTIDYVWRIQQKPTVYLSLGGFILAVIGTGVMLYVRELRCEHESHDASRIESGLVGWGILTFFFILAPTSSIMPIADLAFEHRMYLPLALIVAGLILAVAMGIRQLWRHSENRWVLNCGVGLLTIGLLITLGWRTHVRNLDYRDELTLWRRVTEVAPENPRGWYNVGRSLFERGLNDRALPCLISAVGYGGTRVPIYDAALADSLRRAGRVDEALFFYRRAIENKPEYSEAHNNLGVAYLGQDQDDMARHHFQIAADLGHAEAMHNLALIHERRGEHRRAVEWLERSLTVVRSQNVKLRRPGAPDPDVVAASVQRRLDSNQRAMVQRDPSTEGLSETTP